jgi:acyl-CoA synthetase (AMP-forming)/AMP-acid ligase II
MTAAAASAFGPKIAVVDGDRQLSYDELFDQARSFGSALVASGLEPGEGVAIWAFNCLEWVIAALGALSAGAVVVPVNTRFKGAEAADVLSRSGARALVTVNGFLNVDYVEMLRSSGVALPALATMVVAHGTASAGTEPWDQFLSRATDEGRAEVDRRSTGLGPDDPADILFTSGTTGAPKGVVQTHGRTLHVAADWVAMTGLCPEDRYLMVNPYFHMFGLKAGILACMAAGATMLPEATFDVDRLLDRVEKDRVTVLPGPPTLYQSILDDPGRIRRDLSSLRVAVTGAADIPVELVRRIRHDLPFSLVVTGYGLTEAGTASATSPEDDVETVATTVGRPRPGLELCVVDADEKEVAPGDTGEILVRGTSVMSHYLDDPKATAEAFTAGGWLRTGDLGLIDPAGCLRIVGRSKDMFIVGGFNVYPAEVENYLREHPAVAQAAVVGTPDERMGEVGTAFVILRPDITVTATALLEWARARMANYKAPRFVEFVDQFPLTATGKVRKEDLRDRGARLRSGLPT